MKVFISHSQEAKPLTRRLIEALKRSGLEVWDDDYDIYPGDNWAKVTGQALEEAEAMVVLLTPGALESTTMQREVSFALVNRQFKNRVIPVLVGLDQRRAYNKFPWIIRYLKTITIPASDKQDEGINQITQALQAVA